MPLGKFPASLDDGARKSDLRLSETGYCRTGAEGQRGLNYVPVLAGEGRNGSLLH